MCFSPNLGVGGGGGGAPKYNLLMQFSRLSSSKMEISETDFFDTLTIQNDQISYVKHVLAPVYAFFTLFGCWGGGGGAPKGSRVQPAHAVFPPQQLKNGNSVAFGSAPRREVDSQPFNPCARPAGSQTETHSLVFLSVTDASLSSGVALHCRPSSGRMVMQPTQVRMVGGSNPGRLILTPPPPLKVSRPGFEPPTENIASAALPFDRRWSQSAELPHCLKPV